MSFLSVSVFFNSLITFVSSEWTLFISSSSSPITILSFVYIFILGSSALSSLST